MIDYFQKESLLTQEQVKTLQAKAEQGGSTSFQIFLKDNPGLTEKSARLIAHLTQANYRGSLKTISIQKNDLFTPQATKQHGAFLVKSAGKEKILCLDPLNDEFQEIRKHHEDKPIEIISQSDFEDIFKKYESVREGADITLVNAQEGEQQDANAFVFQMLKGCIQRGASDVHIDLGLDDQGQAGFKLRYRIDGECQDVSFSSDIKLYRGIVNKLKLDANLKIDERRLPQDGRISFELEGKIYNFRLSFMPNTIRNAQEEKIVLRQMADIKKSNLYDLGIMGHSIGLLEESITYPFGFICVTGPTGSGKTTLLYALLQQIDRVKKNIITLEDPVEAEIPLVNQSQIFHRINYDFAAGLRVILRQDPDIIMVGEMRDEETANKAFEAANTGHLVFSTLHTNTAASTITRLLQMKVPFYFISSSLKFVMAQRLIRRIEPKNAREHPDAKNVLAAIEKTFEGTAPKVRVLYEAARKEATILTPQEGIEGTGYKGRLAILEIMKIDDDIRHIINFENGNEDKIQTTAVKNGMLTMQQYGYLEALRGVTTFEEVNNAIRSQ